MAFTRRDFDSAKIEVDRHFDRLKSEVDMEYNLPDLEAQAAMMYQQIKANPQLLAYLQQTKPEQIQMLERKFGGKNGSDL